MKTLNQHYDVLLKIHSRLEDLICTALAKTMRSADSWLKEHTGKKLVPKQTLTPESFEEHIDRIAYNDAINRRFEDYYELTLTYLKSYLKEKYAVRSLTANNIFQACCDQRLIAQSEALELAKITKYAKSIRKPYNSDGDYAFSDDILMHIVTLKKIIQKLNPHADYKLNTLHTASLEHDRIVAK
jgi:hypothetical protein